MDWSKTITQVGTLLASQQGLKSSFLWQGKPCWGVRTSLRREDVATDAGLAGDYTFSLLVPAGQLEQLPRPRLDKITVDNVPMRILAVERDSVGATIRLHLGDLTE